MRLEGKVSLVTGAAQGIGESISRKLAQEGSDIIIVDIDQEKAEETAQQIRKLGRQAYAYRIDVSDYRQVEDLVNREIEKWGGVDVLVNNAGITRDNLLLRMKEEDWDLVIKINLKGSFNLCKVVSRFMMKKRAGNIVNIASIIGLIGNVGQSNYAASKAGLIGLTKSLAKELAPRNIRVNAVAPGFIQTAMTEKLPEEVRAEMLKLIPLQRIGQVEEVANLVVFLASEDSSYITGQVINVDGGMVV